MDDGELQERCLVLGGLPLDWRDPEDRMVHAPAHPSRPAGRHQRRRKLGGEIEVDETYIGGKARHMNRTRRAKMPKTAWGGKVVVMGLLERRDSDGPSKVRTRIVEGTKRGHLVGTMKENIELGSKVFSDALPTYSSMSHLFQHQFVDHATTYVDGVVHTNGMENYWSLLKRTLGGTYISVEPFHLFRYLDEQAFRFNERHNSDAGRFDLAIRGIVGKRLTYDALIAKNEKPPSPAS